MKARFLHQLQKLNMNKSKLLFALPALTVAVFFFALAIPNVYTQTYELEKYSTAPETIRSPITIENKQKTEQQLRAVTQAVEDQYTISEDIAEERLSMISEIYDVVEETKSQGENLTNEEQVTMIESLLTDELSEGLPTEVFLPLLRADQPSLNESQRMLETLLHNYYKEGVQVSEVEDLERRIDLEVQYSKTPLPLKPVISDIGAYALVENSLFDPEKTDRAIKKAAATVEPVMIRAGEVIVSEGSTITGDIYDDLLLTGLLDQQRNILPSIGLAMFALLLGAILYVECRKAVKKDNWTVRHIFISTLVSLLMITLMKVFSLFGSMEQPVYYLFPAVTGVMIIKILCSERFAIVMAVVYSLMACLLFNGQLAGALHATAGMYLLLSQLAGIFFLTQSKDRLSIVRASAGVAFTNICAILFFLFISFEKYSWSEVLLYSGYGVSGAFLSTVLTLGFLPFIETGFGVLSDQKLLTLASPNHPLLRKILVEAPGTYHHSVMVANLSEAACESIGAHGLLARVASYYHDLGKTVHPHYFIENQMGMRNPHDFLEPEQSAEMIINHPYEGARMLKKSKIPDEIIDIAEQHHGTTLLKYFYYQAKEMNEDTKECDYRYPGPKPQSKEAAIVCICDSVEAAVRSLNHPTEEKIHKIVKSILEDRMLDGQLDDSNLTFNELKTMETAICETMHGFFHSRIEYPENKPLVKEAK
ncbi:HDIG domain-containing protein [Halobacillus litoralis]|uniref:HD family phosphohydrolase n=1 Tax=Halobacillus litoralis TaxID=45668 RepID=UPI001CFE10D6|nr:HDIG domain-containing metalloprotein [Halobacillus litoralis]WLR46231.1 HDIG domain-containing protein [Halobacillus litoralis]